VAIRFFSGDAFLPFFSHNAKRLLLVFFPCNHAVRIFKRFWPLLCVVSPSVPCPLRGSPRMTVCFATPCHWSIKLSLFFSLPCVILHLFSSLEELPPLHVYQRKKKPPSWDIIYHPPIGGVQFQPFPHSKFPCFHPFHRIVILLPLVADQKTPSICCEFFFLP